MATSSDQYFPWDTSLYDELNSTSANIYTTNPMRRDTFTMDAFSWALIRFRSDSPGMWAFHCHNIWHMEAGLLMQFMAVEQRMKALGLPADVAGLCNA
jgi:FtsP/CotA-like multicopper oxidase with cupredoxin domain